MLWLPLRSCRFEFLAGDDVFLGAAAKVYAAEGSNWRRSYYLPTSADLAITKMRQWMVSQHCVSGAYALWHMMHAMPAQAWSCSGPATAVSGLSPALGSIHLD